MAKFSTEKTWSRIDGFDEVSANTYNGVLGLTTIFGLGMYAVAGSMTMGMQMGWMSFILLFVLSMVGVFVAASDNPGFKIVGLTLIAGGLGAITGPALSLYKIASVTNIAFATIMITIVLGAAGWMYPKSLESWHGALFGVLGFLIVAQFGTIILTLFGIPMVAAFKLLDWVGVLLFSAYIIYDFNRAQQVTKTVENAIDCGVSVFLDIANLFIRLLSIFGVLNDD